jgi:hypothetical protein
MWQPCRRPDGITLARNYAEMRHENLFAAGDAGAPYPRR